MDPDVGEEPLVPRGTAARATVRTAVPLRDAEQQALQKLLERLFRRPLELDIEITPSIIGGVWVRIGDEVIDGSVRGRLEALRHHLRTQSRIMLTSNIAFTQPKDMI